MQHMSLTWFYHVSQQVSTHVHVQGIVPIYRVDQGHFLPGIGTLSTLTISSRATAGHPTYYRSRYVIRGPQELGFWITRLVDLSLWTLVLVWP